MRGAAVELSAERYQEAMNLVATAVYRGGDKARAQARTDVRLNELMYSPAFKNLVNPKRKVRPGGKTMFPGVQQDPKPGMPSFGGR